MSRLAWLLSSLTLAVPATALAHAQLDSPVKRVAEMKAGPCGAAGSVRGTNVTVMEPGTMLEVRWTETINHPSHYRISFDPDGQDFTIPNDFMDFSQTLNVLADNIPDGNGGSYTQMVQLPSEPCENCTLQLIQMMYDKAPYGDGNDIYFQCADIALRVGGGPGPGPDAGGGNGGGGDAGIDPGTPDDTISGGCSASSGQTSGILTGLLAAGVVGLMLTRRKRPSL
jgi:MYXO-CTERM domain-containing protein